MNSSGFDIRDVLQRDMCVGCGACALVSRGISMYTDDRGMLQADISSATDEEIELADAVCPFSDGSPNENELSAPHPHAALLHDNRLGTYSSTWAARRTSDVITDSSSGGLTSWIAKRLVETGEVDGVIRVGRAQDPGELFETTVTSSAIDVEEDKKSFYYSTTLADSLRGVRGDGRRYAVIGVPCFIRAMRAVCERDTVLRSQLPYFLGLVCGHMKSQQFAQSLAWQVGVQPAQIQSVDFRIKREGHDAGSYLFGARSTNSTELVTAPTRDLVGGNWGHGAFQPGACNFCDDIFAETADVAFGDAWIPRYRSDWKGTNVVVSRNSTVDGLLQEGRDDGQLMLEALSPDDVAASQAGNFRHRRLGLSARLQDDISAGLPVPKKRVDPGYDGLSAKRLRLIRHRRYMSSESFSSFARAKDEGDLSIYLNHMATLSRQYERILGHGALWNAARRAKHLAMDARRGIQNIVAQVRSWRGV